MRKRTAKQPFSSRYHFLFFLYTITETHIQTRKLRAVSVLVSYPPFFNSIFRQANTSFSQNRQYPTPFYLSVLYYHGNPRLLRDSILFPDSTIFPPIAILSAALKNTIRTTDLPGGLLTPYKGSSPALESKDSSKGSPAATSFCTES